MAAAAPIGTGSIQALAIDMDQTLIPDDELALESARAVADQVATLPDAQRLPGDLTAYAAELLANDRAMHAASDRYGISANECLWARFRDTAPGLVALASFAQRLQSQSWERALGRQGLSDPVLAAECAARFIVQRRSRHRRYPATETVLGQLAGQFQLALLINGSPSLQAEKIAGTALAKWFEAILISGQLDTAKPDPATYAYILAKVAVAPERAVMIGDNPINDVAGAKAVGMRAIWVSGGRLPPAGLCADAIVEQVGQLPAALAALNEPATAARR